MPYHRPTELSEALNLVSGTGAQIIAGGTDVYPAMQQGMVPETFVDITAISELRGISLGPDGYRFGAATTWSDILRADLPAAFDGLKASAREVGSVQIQNVGTVAGNLCNASPAADGVPPLLTLDAEVEIARVDGGTRRLPLGTFLRGVRQTDLRSGDVVTTILVPNPAEGARSVFDKLGSRKYLVISITMVSVLAELDADGRIVDAKVAVGACSPVAQRMPALETDIRGQFPEDVVVSAKHLGPLTPIDDMRGSAEYRMAAVAEQCKRAIHRIADHV